MTYLLPLYFRLGQTPQDQRIDRFRPSPLPLPRLDLDRSCRVEPREERVLRIITKPFELIKGQVRRRRRKMKEERQLLKTHEVSPMWTSRRVAASVSATARAVAPCQGRKDSRRHLRLAHRCASFRLVEEGEDWIKRDDHWSAVRLERAKIEMRKEEQTII
jgi:hypothetical protein